MNAAAGPIQHVVVLMMENHSFDHMLGWLPGIGELDGSQSNQFDGTTYRVTEGAGFSTNPGPAHDLADVNMQLFGTETPQPGSTPTMAGFAQDYATMEKTPGDPSVLMQCYSPDQVPVISALAQNFTVCTRWFCSVPGPTGPNRLYANCASSMGYAGADYLTDSFPASMSSLRSIFGVLTAAGLSWGVYHQDVDFAPELILDEVQAKPDSIFRDDLNFSTFQSHLASGSLPAYSFLTPSLWNNSQHAPDDIRKGENLIADVYDALAGSGYWENTLFILTYDEHGGFYDSVPTPTGVPNPDGIDWNASSPQYVSPPFSFDRLGPRVPAILISPYVQNSVDTRQYEHSSIPATVLELFGLSWPSANQRLATVSTFQDRIGTILRTGLPSRLPRPQMSETAAAG